MMKYSIKKKMNYNMINQQKEICNKFNVEFFDIQEGLKLGISENTKLGIIPINGLRITPEGDTNGWYIWAGEELSKDPNFFKSLHIEHIRDWLPEIEKYLGLPPGWRFLVAGDYVDVWFDENLL